MKRQSLKNGNAGQIENLIKNLGDPHQSEQRKAIWYSTAKTSDATVRTAYIDLILLIHMEAATIF